MHHVPLLAGLGFHDLAMFLVRLIVGCFFLFFRFRWIYDPSRPDDPWFNTARRQKLVTRLCTCGYTSHPYLAGSVALTEIFGGCALIVGLLTVPAAFGLFVVMVFATYCHAKESLAEEKPVDFMEVCSCLLFETEVGYTTMIVMILLLGPGAFSLDALL